MIKKIFYVLIVGVFVLGMTVVPALADNFDVVVNSGETMSGTMVNSSSNSGANLAEGSYGGNGGDGGDIRSRGDVNQSSTGRGGIGGSSSLGGEVTTGAASAGTDAYNEIGSSDTLINRCACENDCEGELCEEESSHGIVFNRTRTMQLAYVGADANTGANEADGSIGGDGGEGGRISADHEARVDESSTGEGADGGVAGAGGLVTSGESTTNTTSVNVLNRNITRMLR
ncbi:MAG: hypothetical protein PF572_05505 [Patescibacteria group bacterium]|jgi:hypothetical protein|nr:hypothetical protein [Patescibacteria group bacterium]